MNYYALRVQPQKEFDVQRALNQLEFPAIVPREFKFRRIASKRRHVKRAYPLFSRYVFAGFNEILADLGRACRDIKEIQGVVSRTRAHWSPLVISEQDVAMLQTLAGREVSATTFDVHKALRPGSMAQIVLGPFAGQTVRLGKVTAKRAEVLLNILNSSHVVQIPISALDAA